MSISKPWVSHPCFFLVFFSLLAVPAISQEVTQSTQRSNESTTEGTVASATRQTFVVRTADNQFYLFVFNRYTSKPPTIAVGSRVRVVSVPGAETGSRLATRVTTLEPASKEEHADTGEAAPIPPAVRELESNIKREARRWRLGVRAGAAFASRPRGHRATVARVARWLTQGKSRGSG